MLHLSSHGGKSDLFFNSSFTKLNKRNGIFVSILCMMKGLNSFHECMNVPTDSQKCSRRGQKKVIYWKEQAYLFDCLFYYWCILGDLPFLDSFHCQSGKTFPEGVSERPFALHFLGHILAVAAYISHP